MKIIATIQARMGSTRLPGKVLREIRGKPLLEIQVERVRRSRLVDEIVVATTTAPADDAIVHLAERLGVGVYRGPEDDVLGRIAGLLKSCNTALHVELAGDSPLSDPQIIDEAVGVWLKEPGRYDYVSNCMRVTYPSGMEAHVYPAAALIEAESRVAADDPLREHVDIHLSRDPARRRLNLAAPPHFHRPDIYVEVDTAVDFAMMTELVGHFFDRGVEHFGLGQILDFLDSRPDLAALNRQEERRWRQFKEPTADGGETTGRPASRMEGKSDA